MIVENPELFPFNSVMYRERMQIREVTDKYRTYYDKQEKRECILCLKCGALSYHPQDVNYLYCGNCHKFHQNEGHRGNGHRGNGSVVLTYDEQGRQREGRLIMEDDRGRGWVTWPDSSQPGGVNGDWFDLDSLEIAE
jgi:hypothetical protein